MEFRFIHAFVEVVRQGGFSQAAKTVFATQSTISKAVKQLETEIGMPLLDRIGHRSVMTAAGEVVFRRGVKLLADREDLQNELDEIRGLRRGVLRLGLPPIGSSTLFAPIFAAYRRRYPGIRIELDEHGSSTLSQRLRAGEVDFAAMLMPLPDDFKWQHVRDEPLVVLMPADLAENFDSPVQLADLKDFPFIIFNADFTLHGLVLERCKAAGFEPIVTAESSQSDFMIELVAAGIGVTFLPKMIAEQNQHPKVRQVELNEPDLLWSMAIAWRHGAYLSKAAEAWLDLVRENRIGSS